MMNTDTRTIYEKRVQDRSYPRYLIGLLIRWKKNLIYARARYIARRRGATIGEGVIMPISVAKKLNKFVTIGSHTSIHSLNFSSIAHPIIIGNNVIIGNNTNFIRGGHNIDSPEWENFRVRKELVIEDYVWVCPYSTILPSVQRIGEGAVIGACSVVVKDVEPMDVVGGNPAKVLRKRTCVHSNLVVESLLGGDYSEYKKVWNKKNR